MPNLKVPVDRDMFTFECTRYMAKECVATQHCLSNQLVVVADDGQSAVTAHGALAPSAALPRQMETSTSSTMSE